MFGIMVYKSFGSVGSDSLVSIPSKGEAILGGHAMV